MILLGILTISLAMTVFGSLFFNISDFPPLLDCEAIAATHDSLRGKMKAAKDAFLKIERFVQFLSFEKECDEMYFVTKLLS